MLGCALLADRAMGQQPVELVVDAAVKGGGAAAAAARLPLRVMFVVDGSASMSLAESGATRWSQVASQLRQDVEALGASGVPVQVTVVKFGSDPSSIDSPGGSGWSGVVASEADAGQVTADIVHRLGSPSGGTALFASMQDAVECLTRDLGTGRYSGGQIVVYSDGEDSSKTAVWGNFADLRAATIAAVRGLRAKHPLSNVLLRTFGKEAEAVAKDLPEVVDLSGKGLSVPAQVTSLAFRTPIVEMDPLRAARTQRVVVRAHGLPPDLADDVTVTVRFGDQVRTGTAPFMADLPLPASEQGLDVLVAAAVGSGPPAQAIVRAPALVLPRNSREWGLPTCGRAFGLSCPIAQPVPLSVRLPEGQAQVTWSAVDGDWSQSGSTVQHPGFPRAGSYKIRVTVATRDGSRSEDISVLAIDPTVRIIGPTGANVGDQVSVRADPASGAFASGARPDDVQWLVDGRPVARGAEAQLAFRQRGKAMVTAEVAVAACGAETRAVGSSFISVTPVPSIEIGDADLVRGAGDSNRISVRVLVASRVGAVRASFNGGAELRAVVSGASASDDATVSFLVPPSVGGGGDAVSVRAVPEVRGDDGRVDVAASERASAGRKFVLRAPSPSIAIEEPAAGHEAIYEVAMPIRFRVEGGPADLGAVRSVRLQFSDGRSETVQVGKDGSGSASVTPRFASGAAEFTIRAEAVDEGGKTIGAAQTRTVVLRKPVLSLRASVDQLHRASKAPADLVVTIASPGAAPGWETSVAATRWTVEPAGTASVASESPTKLVLQVTGTGAIAIGAQVQRAGAEEALGPIRVPVVIDPIKADFRITELNSTRQVGTVIGEGVLRVDDRSEGPIADRSYFLRRGEGEWRAINPDSFKVEAAERPGERIEVKATYASIDGTVVEAAAQEFFASPDHNWALVAVVGLFCVGLSAVAWWLCQDNEFLGATATWSADDLGTEERQRVHIRWMTGTSHCSVVSKRATLSLPSMFGTDEGQFEWLDNLRRQQVKLELGGNLAKPQLTGGSGVNVGSPHRAKGDRSRSPLRTTLQPTADGAEPIYLSISPSPTAAFLGWVSTTVVFVAIWGAALTLFFRGYI